MKITTAVCGLALACGPALAAELTPGQLAAADQVFQGEAQCDMKESVVVRALDGQPGHFELTHRKARYRLVPEETQTGAVRLEDRQAGIVWIQIPAKSMLLNAKVGQRLVDGCTLAEQRPLVLDARDAWALATGSAFGLSTMGR
jgi:hypothetical protein